MALFEAGGFRQVHAVRDDFYIFIPKDHSEDSKYGVITISPMALEKMEVYLSSLTAPLADGPKKPSEQGLPNNS